MFDGLGDFFELIFALSRLSKKELFSVLAVLAGIMLLACNIWVGILIIAYGVGTWIFCVVFSKDDKSEETPDNCSEEKYDISGPANTPGSANTSKYKYPQETFAHKDFVDESGYSKFIVFLGVAVVLLILICCWIMASMSK